MKCLNTFGEVSDKLISFVTREGESRGGREIFQHTLSNNSVDPTMRQLRAIWTYLCVCCDDNDTMEVGSSMYDTVLCELDEFMKDSKFLYIGSFDAFYDFMSKDLV